MDDQLTFIEDDFEIDAGKEKHTEKIVVIIVFIVMVVFMIVVYFGLWSHVEAH